MKMKSNFLMCFISTVYPDKTITEFKIGNRQWIIEETFGRYSAKIIKAIEKVLKNKKKKSIVLNFEKIKDDDDK